MPRQIHTWSLCGLLLTTGSLLILSGCFSSSSTTVPTKTKTIPKSSVPTAKVEFPEGDPSVSAEDGGPGFTGEGWETATPGPLGSPDAIPGGFLKTNIPMWPDNLRTLGTGSNTYLNSIVESLCYEPLVTMHPTTLEFVPALASHWWISEDKMTFRYRIDPRAHWSDGKPVTADDVVATYNLIMDKTLKDPMNELNYGVMEQPVKKSKYIVEVKCKEKHWRNFITFSGMKPLPAHELEGMTGEDYLKDYNFKYTAVTGPYIVLPEDIKKEESLTVTRRPDYWGDSVEANKGLYNFQKIRFVVIRDDRLAFEQASKGDLDFYAVYTAKWWVDELPMQEAVQNNWLIRRKVYNNAPAGIQGLALNMREAPLDDVNVRKALCHLFNRRLMVEKFAYNEYDMLFSYFPNSDMENPNNEKIEYDPQKAVDLLKESGWTERGADGILMKDGKRLSLVMQYNSKGLEKYYTSYKEDLKQAGVELKLELFNPETLWQNVMDRKFQISSMAWSAILFPEPKSNWHSSMANQSGSNNIAGFSDPKADELMDKYNASFDLAERQKLLREMDGIIHAQHPYVLGWYLPCERILYWRKFGTPKSVLNKYDDWRGVFTTWWFDPSQAETLAAARKSGKALEPIPLESRYWDEQPTTKAAE